MEFTAKCSEIENEKKKARVIQWDEVTIAEHDKERGSRQKIDEAPTPYRYMSESDQSDGSDGEYLSHRRRSSESSSGSFIFPNTGKSSGGIQDSWEAFTAKLHYEKHLQDMASGDSLRGNDEEEEEEEEEYYNNDELALKEKVASNGAIRPAMKKAFASPLSTPKRFAPSSGSLMHGNNTKSGHKRVHITPTSSSSNSTTPCVSCPTEAVPLPDSPESAVSLSPAEQPVEEVEDASEKEAVHHRDFLVKRAGHYNEFKVLQALRKKLQEEGDDEDDDCQDEMQS
eukprot:gene4256-4676_t